MTKEQLKIEIDHILNSGANYIRLSELCYTYATQHTTSLTTRIEEQSKEIERLKGLVEKAFNYYYMRGFPHNGHDEELKEFKLNNNL